MLSPGKFHLQVPRDAAENIDFRRWLLRRCKGDSSAQKAVAAACKQDFLFWLNSFGWTYNPKAKGRKYNPFVTWDFQDQVARDLLDSIETQTPLRWQKSREMGASWLALYVLVWYASFEPGARVSIMSRKEEAVDDPADSDSLFWKIDHFLERMPAWLVGPYKRLGMSFNFSQSGGQVVGSATTQDAFVGGRASVLFCDEFGQFRDGEEIYARTADVADCRWFVGTHKSTQRFFYDLCYNEKYAWMKEVCTHWSMHPEKRRGLYRYNPIDNKIDVLDASFDFPPDFQFNMSGDPQGGPFPGLRSPWYDKQCRERPSQAVKMDLDIDPRGASRQFFDAFAVNNLKNKYACEPYWTGDLDYDRETGEPFGLVANPAGLIKLWTKPLSMSEMLVSEYGAGVDVAAGTGATPSCLSIMNDLGEKVLSYTNPWIFATDFAVLCVALCKLFKNANGEGARLAWEIQGSQAFARVVCEILKYRRFYWQQNFSKLGEPRVADKPGVNVQNKLVKLRLFEDYRDGLFKGKCTNRDWLALDEALNFEYSDGGVEYRSRGVAESDASGQGVHHGDPVVADVLAYMLVSKTQQEKKTREKIEEAEWINPMSFRGREKLAEMEEESEEPAWL